jgi:diguanylate cyclase (GGDEF)-like protein/PAS domain S-box-containing protein
MAVERRIPESEQQSETAALLSQLQALQVAFDSSERKVFERALEASERRYRELFDSVLTGVYRTTPEGTVLLANPALLRMLGFDSAADALIRRVDPDTYSSHLTREGQVRGLEETWIRKDGSWITVRETARLVRDSHGSVICYEGIVEDISGAKRAEMFDRGCRQILEMVARNEPLNDILSRIAALIEAQAPGRTCSIALRRGDRLYPIPSSKLGANFSQFGLPILKGYGCCANAVETRKTIVVANAAESECFSNVRELAGIFGIQASWSTPICTDGEVQGTIAVYRNEAKGPDPQELGIIETASRLAAVAVEHRRLYDNLHRQATKDRLTGLPNRFVYEETLADCLTDGRNLALLWIDLDRFKEVNDSLGHHVGDALIKEVAARLRECTGGSGLLARTGGDEFAIVLHSVMGRGHAEACAMRLLAALQPAFQVGEYELFVTASIGVSLSPEDATTAAELQQKADAAMYRAKSRGKNCYAFFEEQWERGARERLDMQISVRRALPNGELRLFYQPQVDLEGHIQGMEALLRWQHPKLGLVPPADFISIAEETGLIVPIGSWVIREACRQWSQWRKAGYTNLKIAVNVSVLQFYFSDLFEIVRSALTESDMRAEYLELELTESLIMRNFEDSTRELQRLRALGLTVAIDDFGTGYSSLSYLQKLPVDLLKIDRSFLQDVDVVSTCALIQAITAVAHSLGLRVAAEGIETQQQLDSIRTIGVDLAQGFLFGKPMPSEIATAYLQTSTSFDTDRRALPEFIRGPADQNVAIL